MSEFKHFDLSERQKVERFLKKQKSLRWIANALGRSVSSISDEVRLGKVNGAYYAKKAEHKARQRRKDSKIQCMKVAMDSVLKKYVTNHIQDDQSPEGISGRLKHVDTHLQYASTKAIYKFIASPHGRQIEKHLYSNAVKKKTGPKRGTRVTIDGRIMIDKRPQKVEKRIEFGHFEADFIESGKGGTGSLLVIVERKTRYPFLKYLHDRSTNAVNTAINELLSGIPVKSFTLDNDISFQKHEELSDLLRAVIFFCHPQSPYEKGTVENRNKAIRRYIPKRSDLSAYTKEYIATVEITLRNRFMKCLNYKTPQEVLDGELQKQKIPLRYGMIKEKLLANKCSD